MPSVNAKVQGREEEYAEMKSPPNMGRASEQMGETQEGAAACGAARGAGRGARGIPARACRQAARMGMKVVRLVGAGTPQAPKAVATPDAVEKCKIVAYRMQFMRNFVSDREYY